MTKKELLSKGIELMTNQDQKGIDMTYKIDITEELVRHTKDFCEIYEEMVKNTDEVEWNNTLMDPVLRIMDLFNCGGYEFSLVEITEIMSMVTEGKNVSLYMVTK